MKRNLYFSKFDGVLPLNKYERPKDFKPVENKQDDNKVFDLIYAPNPLTDLPENALAVFMSKNTSPMVREYIERSLMNSELPANPKIEGISDADMALLTRQRNEPIADYITKVNSYMVRQRNAYNVNVQRYNKILSAKSKVTK